MAKSKISMGLNKGRLFPLFNLLWNLPSSRLEKKGKTYIKKAQPND
ncbi:hypothetical protein B4144_3357 [Bacillus atrophaeus]|nr:hypothetical protein B4144_3357 [Bacillus atrophaeus]